MAILGLALTALLSCASQIHKDRSCDQQPADLCWTADTGLEICSWEMGEESQMLRSFKDEPDPKYIWGMYVRPESATGGDSCYLFPDGSLIIERWYDTRAAEMIAEGDWKAQKDIITVHLLSIFTTDDDLEYLLGSQMKMRLFIVKRGDHIGDSIMVPTRNLESGRFDCRDYSRRRRPLKDWKSIKRDLLKRKIQYEPPLFKWPRPPAPPLNDFQEEKDRPYLPKFQVPRFKPTPDPTIE